MMQLLTCVALLSLAADEPPDHVKKYLARCAEAKAAEVALPLPPKKDDLGIFPPAKAGDARREKSVDVLEVVDDDEAIVRAWYLPAAEIGHEPTFVDLWLQGIDTSDLAAEMPARFSQVFHAVGNKLFDTTCGKRSVPLLEPIDLKPYRQPGP
jgi:hypothetical protein